MATHCEFGEGALRERLVCRLRNEATQTKLLAEDKLTLETAIELASALETAESQTKQLRMNTEIAVHRIKLTIPTNKAIPDYKCYCCSSNAHMGQSSPIKRVFVETVTKEDIWQEHVARSRGQVTKEMHKTTLPDTRVNPVII